jgi:hypothetical protein
MQKQNIIIKTPDLYYKERNKLDSFFVLINIYVFFNTYLFGTEITEIIYIVNYFRGISFN